MPLWASHIFFDISLSGLRTWPKKYLQTHGSQDSVTEWLRWWTRNPLGSARRGSNPLAVASLAEPCFCNRDLFCYLGRAAPQETTLRFFFFTEASVSCRSHFIHTCGHSFKSLHWGLNPGPSVYKTDALPLSYRGISITFLMVVFKLLAMKCLAEQIVCSAGLHILMHRAAGRWCSFLRIWMHVPKLHVRGGIMFDAVFKGWVVVWNCVVLLNF